MEQIKGQCFLTSFAGKVLSGGLKDPVTEFKALCIYPAEYNKIPIEAWSESEETILQDPVKVLRDFLQGALNVSDVETRDAVPVIPAGD